MQVSYKSYELHKSLYIFAVQSRRHSNLHLNPEISGESWKVDFLWALFSMFNSFYLILPSIPNQPAQPLEQPNIEKTSYK